jgi:hypothetical protein
MGNLTGRVYAKRFGDATRVIFIFGSLLILLPNRITSGRRQPMEMPSCSEVWVEMNCGRGTKPIPVAEMTLVFHEILQTPPKFHVRHFRGSRISRILRWGRELHRMWVCQTFQGSDGPEHKTITPFIVSVKARTSFK